MSKVNKRHVVIYVLATCLTLAILFVGARARGLVFGGMFGGRVLDKETGKPMAGAYVIARWEDYSFNRTNCVHMDIEITNSEGEYFFGPWLDFVGRAVISQNPPRRMVYAPGYEKVNYGNPVYIRKHRDNPKERIKELRRMTSLFCGDSPGSERVKENRLRRDIYYEGRAELRKIDNDPNGDYKFRVELMKQDCGSRCQ